MLMTILGLGLNLIHFGSFVSVSTSFLQIFLGYGSKQNDNILGWDVHNTYRETRREQITIGDKMKN